MKRTNFAAVYFYRLAWVTLAIVCHLTLNTFAQDNSSLRWVENGIADKVRGFRPLPLALTNTAPESIKRAPLGLTKPRYGSLQIGPADAPATILVITDQAGDKPTRLFLDSNVNGDLTDDPINMWTENRATRPNGTAPQAYHNNGWISIPFAAGPRKGYLKFYTVGSTPERNVIYYYCDYGLVGNIKLGFLTVPAVLQDAGCTGDFQFTREPNRAPLLWLELDKRFRAFPITQPFELDKQWWQMANLSPGGSFKIAAVAKPEEFRNRPETDLSPGRLVPAFSAQLTSGTKVEFPVHYAVKW